MNFELEYTKEQEDFRKEVRSWLEENAVCPEELGPIPLEEGNMSWDMYQWGREFQRKLGAKGWLFPTFPSEYGGGGLPAEKSIVIAEELSEREYPVAYYHIGNLAMSSVYVWGTEEQKERFARPIAQGELCVWQAFTEPEGGSDLASLKTRATKDGDDFIINGQKMWIGDQIEPDMLWTPAVTDPDAPRHQNLGAFMIPTDLPGITIHDLNLVVDRRKRLISFDGVRVSREYLIGAEGQGWRVISTSLELELGAGGRIQSRVKLLDDVLEYARNNTRNGAPISSEPFAQQSLASNYIDSNIQRLIGLRNYWMHNSGENSTYHGSQSSFMGKHYNALKAERVRSVLGPYAITSDSKWGPLDGRVEEDGRSSLVGLHPGGTYDVQKLIMARRLGISRTQERAAPTPGQKN